MAAGFEVTMSDLLAAAQDFRAQAQAFSGLLPGNGPAPVDGGSWVINDALSLVLESVGLLHTQLTATIQQDAGPPRTGSGGRTARRRPTGARAAAARPPPRAASAAPRTGHPASARC